MPIDVHPRRKGPTSDEVIAEQKRQAAALLELKKQAAASSHQVPAKVAANMPAPVAIDNRTAQEKYLDELAPSSGIVGRLSKFDPKGARFVTTDDGEAMGDTNEFYALCDETLTGRIKFSDEEGVPPERHMGLYYEGYIPPARETLGDMDEREWPIGLTGKPEDPWRLMMNLVLQETETRELFTFSTQSKTGRGAVVNLLRHYDRLRRTHPDDVPIVRLKVGYYTPRERPQLGPQAKPVFAVVGKAPRNCAARPEIPPPDTSVDADLNDEIPHM